MNKEIVSIICMGSGVILFALGGTGFKWARRFLLPAVLSGMALLSGFAWQACLGYAFAQSVTLSLPYGERTPYWLKAVVFASYALPSLFFGFTIWQIFLAIGCFGLFVLSNLDKTAKSFPWKIAESAYGFLLGAVISALILQTY